MTRLRVAHIQEYGAEMILVPIGSDFAPLPAADKKKILAYLRLVAAKAGLSGVVVPIWDTGGGKLGFLAPERWHHFFSGINVTQVAAALNSEIDW